MSGNFGTTETGFEWNFYDTMEQGHMTNNPSEGANNRLASRSGTAHPGFYQFCSLISKEVENTKTKLEQFEEANVFERENSRSKIALRSRLKVEGEHQPLPAPNSSAIEPAMHLHCRYLPPLSVTKFPAHPFL